MDGILSIVQETLAGLDALHTSVYGAATAALGRAATDLWAAPTAIVLAFALGMVHALMPGHGKTVIFSYLMGNGARLVTGIAMAMKIAALHVATAVVLLLVIGAAVVRFGRMQGTGRVLEVGSYLAVAAMGAWLLWRAIARSQDGGQGGHEHDHRRDGLLAYAVGLLPCPLTIILMNYALVNETLVGGLMLVAVMAMGIAVTMTLTGMLGLAARRLLTAEAIASSLLFRHAAKALEVAGAAIILAVGAIGVLRLV
jgi:ABC-type nickel/cobalt efflux system permease component RcnA